jgi:hypothetical protein
MIKIMSNIDFGLKNHIQIGNKVAQSYSHASISQSKCHKTLKGWTVKTAWG